MFFADFIQRLRPIIGDGRSIPQYVLFILKMVITEPSSEKGSEEVTIVNDIFNEKISESTLKSYYYGKTTGKEANKQIVGDNINKLAQSIEHYLDTEKFKGCFKSLQFNYEAANKLKASFKDILADEANDKIVDRLADELKTIILKAAGSKNEATSSVNIVSDAADSNISNKITDCNYIISKNDKEEIKTIIRKIHDSMYGVGYWYEGNIDDISFQEKYSVYMQLNHKLLSFGLVYPFIESIKELPKRMLKREDFFIFQEGFGQKVLEYKRLLDGLIQELLKYP